MKVPVLIPRIFDHPHTYLSGKFGKLKVGSVVQVPFGLKVNRVYGIKWMKLKQTLSLKQFQKLNHIHLAIN